MEYILVATSRISLEATDKPLNTNNLFIANHVTDGSLGIIASYLVSKSSYASRKPEIEKPLLYIVTYTITAENSAKRCPRGNRDMHLYWNPVGKSV